MGNSTRLLSAIIVWVLGATAASTAACITGGDEAASNAMLQFDESPNATSIAKGGVQPGQCNVVLSGRCKGQWCLAPAERLDGWVTTRSDVDPSITFQIASSDSATLSLEPFRYDRRPVTSK
ncbi:MAG: hypothetical protein AAF580_11015, partial [Pseudomonadota bacterium]